MDRMIYTGEEAREQFDADLAALNEIRAKQMRIENEQVYESSRLLLSIYRNLFGSE